MAPVPGLDVATRALATGGYAFVHADVLRRVLDEAGLRDWDGFADSWNALGDDLYMADGGRYRRRRFAAFSVVAGRIARKPRQPHYQSRDYNQLNGGVARWFEPVTDPIAEHPATRAIVQVCDALFTALTPEERRPRSWHVELHQFRIVASADAEGRPTPEGMHRDGVDWVLVLLVRRENVASGVTLIADAARARVGDFTLTEPGDAALVDDRRVWHGVTAIHPLDPSRPAWRDVMVLTFRHE